MSSIKIETKNNGTMEFGVMKIPDRKSRALFVTRGAMVEVLAYFRSDDQAERFENLLDFMIVNMAGSYHRDRENNP